MEFQKIMENPQSLGCPKIIVSLVG